MTHSYMYYCRQSHRKNQALAIAVVKLYLSDPVSVSNPAYKLNFVSLGWEPQNLGRESNRCCLLYKRLWKEILLYSNIRHAVSPTGEPMLSTAIRWLKLKVWEQEIYLEMAYKAPQLWFHNFEAEHSMAGLSFADERLDYELAASIIMTV